MVFDLNQKDNAHSKKFQTKSIWFLPWQLTDTKILKCYLFMDSWTGGGVIVKTATAWLCLSIFSAHPEQMYIND